MSTFKTVVCKHVFVMHMILQISLGQVNYYSYYTCYIKCELIYGDILRVCLQVSLYVSNHFNHCIKLFTPCGPLIGNEQNIILVVKLLSIKQLIPLVSNPMYIFISPCIQLNYSLLDIKQLIPVASNPMYIFISSCIQLNYSLLDIKQLIPLVNNPMYIFISPCIQLNYSLLDIKQLIPLVNNPMYIFIIYFSFYVVFLFCFACLRFVSRECPLFIVIRFSLIFVYLVCQECNGILNLSYYVGRFS